MPSVTHVPVRTDPRFPVEANSEPSGRPMRISITSASGAFQLRVVVPRKALPVTGMGFGLAVRDGPTEGQGALIEVRQTLPTNAFAPAAAWFRMSTLALEGLLTDT